MEGTTDLQATIFDACVKELAVEEEFVIVPRSTTFVMSHTIRYRRPGGILYRLFAALIGEYEIEETTVFAMEETFDLDEAIKDEEVEAELRTLLM